MKNFLNFICAVLLAMFTGCATSSHDTAQNSGPTDICHVCQYNNDLACVCVKVKDTTPRTEYQGMTYYFCSEDCRTAFAKNAAKYLPKGGTKQ
jgi:YHS domain-containing protein